MGCLPKVAAAAERISDDIRLGIPSDQGTTNHLEIFIVLLGIEARMKRTPRAIFDTDL